MPTLVELLEEMYNSRPFRTRGIGTMPFTTSNSTKTSWVQPLDTHIYSNWFGEFGQDSLQTSASQYYSQLHSEYYKGQILFSESNNPIATVIAVNEDGSVLVEFNSGRGLLFESQNAVEEYLTTHFYPEATAKKKKLEAAKKDWTATFNEYQMQKQISIARREVITAVSLIVILTALFASQVIK